MNPQLLACPTDVKQDSPFDSSTFSELDVLCMVNSVVGDVVRRTEGLQIPILSEILGCPVPREKFLVGLYEPSAHWLSLILTMASGVLRNGHVVNVVTVASPPSQIRRELGHNIAKVDEFESSNKLLIADWHTWMTGKKSAERISVGSLSVGGLSLDQSIFVKELSPTYDLVVVDNISMVLKYNDERSFMQWFDKLVARLKPLKGIRLYGFVKGFHSEALYSNVEALADGVIELNYREHGGKLENAIRIKSLKGMMHHTEWKSLEVNPDGTLRLSR